MLRRCLWAAFTLSFAPALAASHPATTESGSQTTCRRAVFEGEVTAGQPFERAFTRKLRFYLEPLSSGWIVRVLPTGEPRGAHDYAELATPPYQSVSPLLISTDWSFRAQDAVAWNPRTFRFAGDKASFLALEHLQVGALAGNAEASADLAGIVAQQPEGSLELLDVRFAPGVADQAKTASTVALHLARTPHTLDEQASPSSLGRLERIRFRVSLELPPKAQTPQGVAVQSIPCVLNQPATHVRHPTH